MNYELPLAHTFSCNLEIIVLNLPQFDFKKVFTYSLVCQYVKGLFVHFAQGG